MADPAPDMLAAALSAHDAGLCVIRATTDGKKRPYGEWKQYQSQRPSREQVAAWFASGHPAMGAVTGAVSGDLEMFELEGRFMDRFGSAGFSDRMREAGLELLLARLTKHGMVTMSPSGGRHFLYRVSGAVEGNTKLAANAERVTMIETRGEGGFVVLPPSHGATHPSGKPWTVKLGAFDKIPHITADERESLFAVARGYDESSPVTPATPPAPTKRITVGHHAGQVGPSWVDAVVEHLKATTPVRTVLESHGWTYEYTDRHGRDMLRRPGKDDDGVSGSVNDSGRLLVFSSATPFDFYTGTAKTPTYDALDVIAMYEHGNDRQAAARHIADTTGIMDAWRRAKDAATARPNIDPSTGEVIHHADEDMWHARPALEHILTAARSRLVAPWAVLGCILARVAAFTPPSTCIPGIVGGSAPLSLYVALYGRSGAGKSSPGACATDLLPELPPSCIGPVGLGSGEGLVEAYMELVEETDGGGKKTKVKRQVKHGALFTLDEGQMLAEIGSRKGSTILPVLRTAWSGGDPGQANASIETRRTLKPGTYAVGLVSLWQDKAGAALIADVDGGTPQRFVWFGTTDLGATRNRPAWPGRLKWTSPPQIGMGGVLMPNPLDVAQPIVDEIVDARIAQLHAQLEESPLDAHRRLNKLKLAGLLAVLDGRQDVTVEDWSIAEEILKRSDGIRDWVVFESRREDEQKASVAVARAVAKDQATEESAYGRALGRAARTVWRVVVAGGGEPVGRSGFGRSIASRDRALVTVDEAIEEAERLRWIALVDVMGAPAWTPGESRPS